MTPVTFWNVHERKTGSINLGRVNAIVITRPWCHDAKKHICVAHVSLMGSEHEHHILADDAFRKAWATQFGEDEAKWLFDLDAGIVKGNA